MLADSLGAKLGFAPFVLVGVAMLVWNRRLAKVIVAGNRAVAEELGFAPLQRLQATLDRQRWLLPAIRAYIVVFALLWLGICIYGLAFTG